MFDKELQKQYIEERMTFFALNISDFNIGDEVLDTDGAISIITDKTKNTIEVEIDKKASKSKNKKKSSDEEEIYGIKCRQWFTMDNFNRRFKKK